MKLPRSVIAAATAASIVGGAAGAMLFAPAIGSAQDAPTEQAPPEAAPESPAEGERPEDCHRPGHRGPRLEGVAEAIGIEADALREALSDGQTMAEVAEANGVDPQVVIDAMITRAGERLDQAVEDGRLTQEEADEKRAELAERITTRVNEGPPERGEGEGPRGPRPGGPPEGEAPEGAPDAEGSSFAPPAPDLAA